MVNLRINWTLWIQLNPPNPPYQGELETWFPSKSVFLFFRFTINAAQTAI